MTPRDLKFYFSHDVLIRKEFFGTLILLLNGQRFIIDNKFIPILKALPSSSAQICKKTGVPLEEIAVFLESLKEKGIVANIPKLDIPNVRIVEKKFISQDCLSFPRTVYWECTRRCNFRCIHCYSSSGIEGAKGMSLVNTKKMIDELSQNGVEFLNIGGGEPLLYPHIYKTLRYAADSHLMVEMTTNGSLINDQVIKKLSLAGLEFIQVSLDGACGKTYQKIRKGGNFDLVVSNIKKLAEKFTVSICMVATKLNFKETDELVQLSKKLGAKYFRVIPLLGVGRGSKLSNIQLSTQEFRDYHKSIQQLKEKEKNNIYIQLNENLILPDRKNITWMPEEHYGCPAGRTTCGIDPNGNVYPCSYMNFKELLCGNITEQSLLSIWQTSTILKDIRQVNHLKGKCSDCKYLDDCRGGCRASAYLKNRKINDSDPLCSIEGK